MANVLSELFSNTANAIREKTGDTATIAPANFPTEIGKIEVGSGGENVDAINDRLDTILGEVVGENRYTVTFVGADGSTLHTETVIEGDDCADPVWSGRIAKPTKESTAYYTYSYYGWAASANGTANSSLLKNITEDKTLYAVFEESERKYTVRFYDGSTLLKTEYFTYGGSSTYTYKKDNYIFKGWLPEPTNITSDMDCYAQLEESYTFVDASWEYIADISARGLASRAFAVGDTKDVEITVAGTTYTLPVQIVGFDLDDLADGSGKAGISIITVPIMSTYKMMWDITGSANAKLENGIQSYVGSNWSQSEIRTALNDTIFACLQSKLRSVIKPVLKESMLVVKTDETTAIEVTTTSDKLWLPSAPELGGIDLGDGTPYEYFETYATTRRQRTLWEGIPDNYPAYSSQLYGTRSFPVGGGTGFNFNAQTGEPHTNGSGTRRHLVGFCV